MSRNTFPTPSLIGLLVRLIWRYRASLSRHLGPVWIVGSTLFLTLIISVFTLGMDPTFRTIFLVLLCLGIMIPRLIWHQCRPVRKENKVIAASTLQSNILAEHRARVHTKPTLSHAPRKAVSKRS